MSQYSGNAADLRGIGGWLVFVAIGQVLGPIQLVLSLFFYQMSLPDGVWSDFPVVMLVELLITLALIGLTIWTSVLFFGERRSFPRMFTIEWIAGTAYYPVVMLWASAASGVPVSDLGEIEEWYRSLAFAAIGFVWVLYVHKSARVRNTFVE